MKFSRSADQRYHYEDVIRSFGSAVSNPQVTVPTEEARSIHEVEGVEAPQEGRLLTGYPVVFNQWTRIMSWDGPFLERILPGAADETLAARSDKISLMFNHGFDYMLEQTPIGRHMSFDSQQQGIYNEAALIDRGVYEKLDLVVELIRLGAIYGQSFRFSVMEEIWRDEPDRSEHNPDGLPERDIVAFRYYESGPVTYPAYEATSVGLRDGEPFAVRSREEFQLWCENRSMPTLKEQVEQVVKRRDPRLFRSRSGEVDKLREKIESLTS